MKKIFSLFLISLTVLSLIFSLFGCNNPSGEKNDDNQYAGPAENLEFQLTGNEEGYEVVGIGECVDKNLLVPSTHNGLPVLGIGENAFKDCTFLKSFKIPTSVKVVDFTAFIGCTSLEKIEVEEGHEYFKSIDGNLYHPDGISLYIYAPGKNETSFTIPDGVKRIENAFVGCTGLESVSIPTSVTSIAGGAFNDCTSLTEIHYAGTKGEWEKIGLMRGWDHNTGDYTIYCTDGEIKK